MRVTRHFDLIVVGSGPAGAAAAMTALAQGLHVALVDKARFPRDKLCGGLVTGRALGHLCDIFGTTKAPVDHVTRRQIAFYGEGVPLGGKVPTPPITLLMRRALDAALTEQALQRGASDFTGCAGALAGEGRVLLKDHVLKAPLVIGADGVNSTIARQLFGAAFDHNDIGFALEVECDLDPESVPLRVDLGAAEWGYGWQFPKPSGVTIGLGGLHRRNPAMKQRLATYMEQLDLVDAHTVKGQFLPFGSFRPMPGRGAVLLAGDAAGLVDPITGEGIGHALFSGARAGEAAALALMQGQPNRALHHYKRSLAPLHADLKRAVRLRPLLFSRRLQPWFQDQFARSEQLRGDFLKLLAGETDYASLTRSTLHRVPRRAVGRMVRI